MRVVNGSVIGWLLVTTNYVFRNQLRSKRRYRDAVNSLPPPENTPDHTDGVDDRLDTDARRAAVRAALAQLPKRDQDIITLCVFEEQPASAAAATLGVAAGTVKSRLSRAKARLAALLSESDGSDTGAATNGGER
jgi:RNA polymerase sigma factor (sigma-70 family)